MSGNEHQKSLSSLSLCDSDRRCSYRNSKVYEVTPLSEDQMDVIKAFRENPEFDFWTPRTSLSEPIDIMVSPELQDQFQKALQTSHVEYKVIIEDVDLVVTREKFYQSSTPDLINGALNFEKYHRYDDIQDYLHHLAVQFSNLVLLDNYGLSYENRNLTLIRISSGGSNGKPAIFIDAGIHAREWIGPALALYIIHQLIENPENKNLIEKVDWLVIPLLNPDGYEYTHTENRFWRKTRSKGQSCHGVDPNRNFDFHWMGPGASSDEYSQTYAGAKPFSEPETLALSQVIDKYSDNVKLYITIHSAAKCLLYPWGYTTDLPEDADELHDLARKVAEAIYAVNGTTYRIGNSTSILVPSSGSSRDWVKGVCGIELAYTLELPGGGEQGFDLPTDRILEVVEEVFVGIKVFHEHIEDAIPRSK